MQVTFLGTSSGAPTRQRNVSAIALQFDQQSRLWLFDCGEGTQQQFLRSPLRPSQLDSIFITHVHGDHIFGLPGLLSSRSLQYGSTTPLTLYGPEGVEEYVQSALRLSRSQLGYEISYVTIRPGKIYEDETLAVSCAPLEHRVPAFGYAVQEKPLAGHFDVEAARALGVPPGPLYGRLKNGETITLEDGRQIDGKRLVGAPRPGRKLVYCTDTVFCQSAIELARDADVLIHESTYAAEDADLAERGGHSTTLQAAEVARAAGVKTLIITHFSSRYEGDRESAVLPLLKQAQAIFPNTHAAYDFWSYEIQRNKS